MSGIEIAGLVLGAISVAIQTLDICADGLSALRQGQRYKNELQRVTMKLETEQVRLENACEKLFVNLAPQSRIEQLLKDPLGEVRSEPELERKLRVRLWGSYDNFKRTLVDVRVSINEVTDRINAEKQKRSSMSRLGKALCHRSFLDDLLSSISEDVSTIEGLINRNIELEPSRKGRFQGRFLRIIRTVAGGLYRAVHGSLNCQCEHQVCLLLRQQTCDIIPGDEDGQVMESVNFRLALSYDERDSARYWADIRAQPIAKKYPSTPPSPGKEGKKPLRIAEALKSLSSTKPPHSPAVTEAMNFQAVSIELERITHQPPGSLERVNLCGMMRQLRGQMVANWSGLIAESAAKPIADYAVRSISAGSGFRQCDKRNITSLNEILGQNRRYMLLSEKDRLRLAVDLSSSILQLYGSPWMPTVTRSHAIYLVQSGDDPICHRFFFLKNFPHIDKSNQEFPDSNFPRNQTLFYLGVLLIELGLGKSFELLQTKQEQSKTYSGFLKDYMAAKRLLHEVNNIVGPKYASAVERCLDDHNFHATDVSLEDEKLSHDVHSGVVALLEQELDNSTI
ncbi:hypothetical protein NM208_g8907 [Fusarium decemcellulare]|uniref:Uncharacterized protein n=1 Tax=Fusarium decemcellulare TaxID=57161 RepID=A0ACC1S3J3_9HYPO|nr:hypothetical protein NM208_g8907 [Fusarium decemcellulare]